VRLAWRMRRRERRPRPFLFRSHSSPALSEADDIIFDQDALGRSRASSPSCQLRLRSRSLI
jgi:hypothetical protein